MARKIAIGALVLGSQIPLAAKAQALTVLSCHFSYRVSVSDAPLLTQDVRLFLDNPDNERELTLGDFDVRLWSWNDDTDSDAFTITVSQAGADASLHSVLYQAPFPSNGSHGVTGLAYLTHPQSRSELQYYCEIARD